MKAGRLCWVGTAAMSEENVEIARRVIEALNRRDLPSAMKHASTDFSFDFSRSISPAQGVYRRDDILKLEETFFGDWESLRYEPEEFIAVGDQVITPTNIRFQGRDGIELRVRFAWVWLFRDGQVQRITFFQDRADALEAAELQE